MRSSGAPLPKSVVLTDPSEAETTALLSNIKTSDDGGSMTDEMMLQVEVASSWAEVGMNAADGRTLLRPSMLTRKRGQGSPTFRRFQELVEQSSACERGVDVLVCEGGLDRGW